MPMYPCVSAFICLLWGYIPAYQHHPRVLEYVLGNRKAFMKGPDSNYLCLGEEKKQKTKNKKRGFALQQLSTAIGGIENMSTYVVCVH